MIGRRHPLTGLLVASLLASACGDPSSQAVDRTGTSSSSDVAPSVVDHPPGADGRNAEDGDTDGEGAGTDTAGGAVEPDSPTPPAAPETSTTPEPLPGAPLTVAVVCGADPDLLGFDPFYDRYCDAAGIPVVASAAVDPEAVEVAAEVMVAMIGHRPDLIEAIVGGDVRMGIMDSEEVTSDLPEYRILYEDFPDTDWDTRTRGLGATSYIPLSSAAEENILCWEDDVYRGESILVHEFAHTVHIMGLDVVDPLFSARLQAMYDQAMADGRWADTYAATNAEEYFAEAVQSFYDANQLGPAGGDGIHNDIDTRAELLAYDPAIHDLIAEVFPADPLPLCQVG